jgi:flagellar FliJ protein
MRDVKTLIKMQKLYVDEQRKVLAARQREADALVEAIVDLKTNLEIEKKSEAAKREGGFIVGAFIRKELNRQEDLEKALVQTNRVIEVEREKLSILFEEMKRYELIQENWDEEEEKKNKRLETIAYDEQAGTRHQRKSE